MNLDVLLDELTTDSLGRGYSGMTDAEAAADLNVVYRTRPKDRLEPTVVLNAIDKAEFLALGDADQARVWNVLHLPSINPFGIEADLFVGVFGAGSDTITALQAIRQEAVSRGVELGLGKVAVGHAEEARR